MSIKFGTSGLRGLSVDLDGPPTTVHTVAFVRHLRQAGFAAPGDEVFVARDFRQSSPAIAARAMAAIAAAGLKPVDCGALPTPALALLGLRHRRASLMITGSHIPADRNGIKFYRPDGEIDKVDEAAITVIAQAAELPPAESEPAPGDRSGEARALFLDRNRALLPEGVLAGLRVGVYEHSTVARDMLGDILSHFGADCVPLGRSETFIPVDTEAVSSETIAKLKRWAAEHRLDAIVSADGDGDRPLVADEGGTPLRGDLLGLVAADFLGAKVIATPVTSNSGIEAAGNYRVMRTRVGSPYVIAAMAEAVAKGEGAVMGFEANGGTLTATPFAVHGGTLAPLPTRDCFLPILAALYRAVSRGKPLSALASGYALPVAASDRIENYVQERSAALMAMLRSSPEALAAFLAPVGLPAETSDIDGLRITLEDRSIIHLRPSGNAPEMRCYVEARDEAAAQELLAKGLALLSGWVAG
ncbi:phosphomannomutase [Rhizobium sp. TRM95111]|uniref:phosphomannomutase n=1 Tax=Rhizobium alarense TaxID=2846851 RepID=UPI001F2CF5A1|nr:phosphomannomutase [Rhizobium alarense]MCF3638959.1 phosphomannomutase [Rhizobium alarense]